MIDYICSTFISAGTIDGIPHNSCVRCGLSEVAHMLTNRKIQQNTIEIDTDKHGFVVLKYSLGTIGALDPEQARKLAKILNKKAKIAEKE